MIGFRGKMAVAVAGLVLVTAAAQIASAQPGGQRGRGMGFGAPSLRLATLDKVQSELKLSDEQKTKIADISEGLRSADRQSRRQAAQDAADKLAEVLDKDQAKRLAGIDIQVMGPQALHDPLVMAQLNLSDEQKTKISDVQSGQWQAMRDARDEMQDMSREERRAKMGEMRDEMGKKLMDVLTTEQKTQFEDLKGEPVDIDMSQLRGPGRRGGNN